MVIAAVLLMLWVAFLFEGRREMYRTERLSYDFIFKWNVLPLLVALELLTTSSLLVLVLGGLAFVLCWPIAKFAITVAPLLTGWHVGMQWFSTCYPPTDPRLSLSAVMVALALVVFTQTIVVALRRPPLHT